MEGNDSLNSFDLGLEPGSVRDQLGDLMDTNFCFAESALKLYYLGCEKCINCSLLHELTLRHVFCDLLMGKATCMIEHGRRRLSHIKHSSSTRFQYPRT